LYLGLVLTFRHIFAGACVCGCVIFLTCTRTWR
jgi:hypothetical protein